MVEYEEEKQEQLQIAQTIIQQMGGNGRLKIMVGMWNPCVEQNGVSFRFKGSKIANYVKVILEGNDTYTVTFMLINAHKGSCTEVKSFKDAGDVMLQSIFEETTKLRLSL
jgi:uncharacterized Fe-S cluster-containing protein